MSGPRMTASKRVGISEIQHRDVNSVNNHVCWEEDPRIQKDV